MVKTMKTGNGETFVKITNREVYDKIVSLEAKVEKALTTTKINAAIISLVITILALVLASIIR